MKQKNKVAWSFLGLTVLTSANALAGGLFVPGYGTAAQQRGGAFVAKADDPSTLYYNPAGFAKQEGTSIYLGFNFLEFSQSFTRLGSYEDAPQGIDPESYQGQPYGTVNENSRPQVGVFGFQAVPIFAIGTDFGLGKKVPLRFGFGIITEHAYPERGYDNGDYEFEDPNTPAPPQRYDVMSQQALIVFPSVAVAYSLLPNLQFGVRGSWGIGHIKGDTYLWTVRNYEETVHRDALFSLDVKDNFIPALQVGALYQPLPFLEFGASYTTRRSVNAKGSGVASLGNKVGTPSLNGEFIPEHILPIDAAGGGTCTDAGYGDAINLNTCLDVALPAVANVGARYIFRDIDNSERGDIELNVQWEGWSDASDTRIHVDGKSEQLGRNLSTTVIRHGFEDTYSIRLGGQYRFDLPNTHAVVARGGVAYDTAAAKNSWTRVDQDGMNRFLIGTGISYELKKWRFDLGGGYVFEPTRTVGNTCNPTNAEPGCLGTKLDAPVLDRDAPDPVQPLFDELSVTESPINAGTYKQHYVLFSMGAAFRF